MIYPPAIYQLPLFLVYNLQKLKNTTFTLKDKYFFFKNGLTAKILTQLGQASRLIQINYIQIL